MSQPLSIENSERIYFITTRTAGSRLWLINNKELERHLLGALAKYAEEYGVILYAFIIMGNHYHLMAKFPRSNRAAFMRVFNSVTARVVGRVVKEHGRRSVWGRRYAHQVTPRNEDVQHWFLYSALNPVICGLVPKIREYHGYNSFHAAATGREEKFEAVDWSAYTLAKRTNPTISPNLFKKDYLLTFARLPGYENHSQQEYKALLFTKLEERRIEEVNRRYNEGKGFMGQELLLKQKVGSEPRHTKTSQRNSHRPLVLTLCMETRRQFLSEYFAIRDLFIEASAAFRSGDFHVPFPAGTYRPPVLVPA